MTEAVVDPAATGDGPARPPRLVTVPFLLVTAATFAYFTSLGMLLPIIPRYVKDHLGGGGFEVGLAAGAFAASAALMRPWVGRLGDTKGRRLIMVAGSLIVGLSVFGYWVASSLAILLLLRLVTGVGEAGMFVGAATSVQDMAPDDRRGEAASYFSVALYLGLAVGPSLGEALNRSIGFHAVWIAAGCSATLAAALSTRVPKGETSDAPRTNKILHPASLGPGFVLFLGMIPFTGYATFLPSYGKDIGVDDVGPVFAVYAGMVLLIRVIGAKLPDRLGWRKATTVALVAVGTASAVMVVWRSAGAVYLAAFFFAIGQSMLFPALFTTVVNATPEEERTQAVGTFSVFFDLASGVGAPLLGAVVALTDERGAFATSVLAAVAGYVALRALHLRVLAAEEDCLHADEIVAEAGEGAGAPVWHPHREA